MAVKYYCPKCGRRFVEWGAQKLDFKCPSEDCAEQALSQVGASELDAEEKQKVKRVKKAKSIVPLVNPEDEVSELGDSFLGGDDAADMDDDEDVEEEEEEEEVVTPVVDDEDGAGIIDQDESEEVDEDDTFAEALDLDEEVSADDD